MRSLNGNQGLEIHKWVSKGEAELEIEKLQDEDKKLETRGPG